MAFLAGLASFTSPCVLPLVPAYLSIVAGFDATLDPVQRRLGRVTRDTLLFVTGFALVFIPLGLTASSLGHALIHNQTLLVRLSGLVIVALAIFLWLTLLLPTPGLVREFRAHPATSRLGPFAAPLSGAAFAFGWTPCVGPLLAAVLALAAQQGHAASGALLLAVYTAGLGLPFVVVALAFDRLSRPLRWLKRHGTAVTAVSASMLLVLGVLLVLDRLAWVTTLAQHLV